MAQDDKKAVPADSARDFQLVFGIESNDPNAGTVVRADLQVMARDACGWVEQSQVMRNDSRVRAFKAAGVSRLRNGIAVAEANGFTNAHGEFLFAEQFLAEYNQSTSTPGMLIICK